MLLVLHTSCSSEAGDYSSKCLSALDSLTMKSEYLSSEPIDTSCFCRGVHSAIEDSSYNYYLLLNYGDIGPSTCLTDLLEDNGIQYFSVYPEQPEIQECIDFYCIGYMHQIRDRLLKEKGISVDSLEILSSKRETKYHSVDDVFREIENRLQTKRTKDKITVVLDTSDWSRNYNAINYYFERHISSTETLVVDTIATTTNLLASGVDIDLEQKMRLFFYIDFNSFKDDEYCGFVRSAYRFLVLKDY